MLTWVRFCSRFKISMNFQKFGWYAPTLAWKLRCQPSTALFVFGRSSRVWLYIFQKPRSKSGTRRWPPGRVSLFSGEPLKPVLHLCWQRVYCRLLLSLFRHPRRVIWRCMQIYFFAGHIPNKLHHFQYLLLHIHVVVIEELKIHPCLIWRIPLWRIMKTCVEWSGDMCSTVRTL